MGEYNPDMALLDAKFVIAIDVTSIAYVDGPNIGRTAWILTVQTASPNQTQKFELSDTQLLELKSRLAGLSPQ